METWPQKIRHLGAGTFGQVYLVSCNGREYALKEIPLFEEKNPALLECLALSNFSCPFLLSAHHIILDHSRIGILTDVAVSNCRKWRHDNKSPSPKLLRDWIYGLLLAVNTLHETGLIHGDIKASNILYFSDKDVRLADFGLTCFSSFAQNFRSPSSPTHRAPEVWRKQKWDSGVDIWAVGCTIFELVFGYPLFPPQEAETRAEGSRKCLACIENWLSRVKINPLDQTDFHDTIEDDFDRSLWSPHLLKSPFMNLILDCLVESPLSRFSAKSLLSKYFPTSPIFSPFILSHKTSKDHYEIPFSIPQSEVRSLVQKLISRLPSSERNTLTIRGLERIARQLIGLPVHGYFEAELLVCQITGFAIYVNQN